ncbi:MAG: LPS export ABC transporter ATP-binding protein [Phycisphaerales bacterium JB061]
MALLQTHQLEKSYHDRRVVEGVSFSVGSAEIVGLLGRNGAGKTTSFRMTIGMIEADGGKVVFDGHDVTDLPMFKRARLGMGYLSQEPSVFQRLTCEQNLMAILETLPLGRRERKRRASELLAQFGLTHKAKEQARTCSGGERRKLEIARSLVTQPKLILLDEPFSGVDPIAVEQLQAEIKKLAQQGIAFLITDHNVQQTLRVCDRAYIIDEGKAFAEGTPKELINDDLVKRVYLGSLFRGDEFDEDYKPAETRSGNRSSRPTDAKPLDSKPGKPGPSKSDRPGQDRPRQATRR